MRKNRSRETQKLIILSTVFGILFLVSFLFLANFTSIKPFDSVIANAIAGIFIMLVVITNFIIFTISIETLLVNHYIDKKEKLNYQKSMEELLTFLSETEFRKLRFKGLNSSESLNELIDDSEIKCEAKIDENKMVVYKITVDAQSFTDDYITFAKYFEID